MGTWSEVLWEMNGQDNQDVVAEKLKENTQYYNLIFDRNKKKTLLLSPYPGNGATQHKLV